MRRHVLHAADSVVSGDRRKKDGSRQNEAEHLGKIRGDFLQATGYSVSSRFLKRVCVTVNKRRAYRGCMGDRYHSYPITLPIPECHNISRCQWKGRCCRLS